MGRHLAGPAIRCAVLCHYGDLSRSVAMQRPHQLQLLAWILQIFLGFFFYLLFFFQCF